jgi:hypothetical protein
MATMKKTLKAVDKSKKPGLAKLPKEVRNKMGYAQTGKNVPKGMVESEMNPGKMIPKSKSNYYTGEYSKMVEAGKGKPAMAKKKAPKAEDGLKTRQYKRFGRIDERNPARAERVADRMKTKASRVERGKEIANPSMRVVKFNVSERMRNSEMKAGGMLKRADGSYSKRGLWDNLRSKAAKNKATGAKPKAPSKSMLSQEKKIKAKGK